MYVPMPMWFFKNKNSIFFCNYFVDHAVLVNQLKVCIIYFNPDTVTTTFYSKFLYLFIFGIALVGGIVSFLI